MCTIVTTVSESDPWSALHVLAHLLDKLVVLALLVERQPRLKVPNRRLVLREHAVVNGHATLHHRQAAATRTEKYSWHSGVLASVSSPACSTKPA